MALPREKNESVLRARSLRRNLTLPQGMLWQVLRRRPAGFKFRRQHPIGRCVVDFYCAATRLVIEVDGEAHSMGDRPARDRIRGEILAKAGFDTLRIAARDVLGNLGGVMTHILTTCGSRPLHHSAALSGPPPRSGEE